MTAGTNKKEDMELCKGIKLRGEFFGKKESRLLTLLLKGFVVYLLTMGSIGFYLSALSINYNEILCHVVILAMAFLCALLYYRLFTENLGYLIMLIVFAGLVILFRVYINSGFYAVVNMSVDAAAQYLNVDIQKLYNEQIGNRYITVTFVVLFIGIVLDIFLNVYISRRMQYVTAFFVIMSLNLIPLYMTLEPSSFYAGMLLAGMALAYVYKSGKHYSPQVSVKRNDDSFAERKTLGKRKKGELAYVYNVKAMLQAGIIAVIYVLVVVIGVTTFFPKESFNVGYKGNKYKELTMSAMSIFLVDGWQGLWGFTSDTAGIKNGELGRVSSVRLDNQTDLIVQYAPYSYDTMYFRSFVGVVYNPYENRWTQAGNVNGYDGRNIPEVKALEAYYNAGGENSAEAMMKIKYVDVPETSRYLPYYTARLKDGLNGYMNVQYFPYIEGNHAELEYAVIDEPRYMDADLYVPEENIGSVDRFIERLGWLGDDEQIIDAVSTYFQENMPYTIKPGKTPKNEDFVNYFLDEGQKGYCTYYASAAVLIFRRLGIPARYVEGYALDVNNLVNGELVENATYDKYYSGYSPIGESAVVQVNLTDADAHAWVEVYSRERGWHAVDVTPGRTEDEEEEDSFWEMFDKVMNNTGDEEAAEEITNEGGVDLSGIVKTFYKLVFAIVCILAIVFLGIKAGRYIVTRSMYARASINDKLIIRYKAFYKKKVKRDRELGKKHNYKEQIEYIEHMQEQPMSKGELEAMTDILERAGFSKKSISREEFDRVAAWMEARKKSKR